MSMFFHFIDMTRATCSLRPSAPPGGRAQDAAAEATRKARPEAVAAECTHTNSRRKGR
jgi:hypothetical protein